MKISIVLLVILLVFAFVVSSCNPRTARTQIPAQESTEAIAATLLPSTPVEKSLAPTSSPNTPVKTVTPAASSPAIPAKKSSPAASSPSPVNDKADLVLKNGRVLTVDAQDRIVQAVAVKGDKIIKVGTTAEIQSLVGPDTKVIDVNGKVITPGIIDAHFHLMSYGRQVWKGFLDIRYPTVKTLDDLLRVVGERAKSIPAGEWISGNQGFHIGEAITFDRYTLDKVAPDNPVYLRHSSGQYSVVNSLALKLAGVNKNTPDPFGGKILRNPSTGEPTGVLLHYPAEDLVLRLAPGYGVISDDQMEEDIKNGQEVCLAAGITSAQDVIVGSANIAKIYKKVADRNELKVRMYLLLYLNTEEQAQAYVQAIKGYKTGMLTMGGWKLAIDGGFSPGTCLMYDSTLAAAKNAYYHYQPEQLKRIVKLLHDTGLQIGFHIVGDKGTDEALDALEAAMKANPRPDPRHRIEHMCFVKPESLSRIKRLGVVVSTQPQWISWNGDSFRSLTNETEMKNFIPIKSILSAGIPLAFGCDAPAAVAHEPNWAFVGAESRKTLAGYTANSQECITPAEVLRIHTMGSAYAAFEEKEKGSIEVGKLADMVVWSQDITSTDYAQVMGAKAQITIVGGQIVYEKK
jgi:predicted amidohydrolase YtcJ